MEHTPTQTRRFEALFDAHHRAILAYALRRTSRPADAADVVAETFLVAWRRLDDIPPRDEVLWLYAVARRVIANARRGELRRGQLAQRLRDALQAVDHPPQHDPRSDRLGAALDTLQPDDREIIRLAYWEDLTPTEVAQVMGMPASTVRVRLHRARTRLRTALSQPQPARTPPSPIPTLPEETP